MCFKVILQKWIPQKSLSVPLLWHLLLDPFYVYVQALLFLLFYKFLMGRGVSDLSFMSAWYLC